MLGSSVVASRQPAALPEQRPDRVGEEPDQVGQGDHRRLSSEPGSGRARRPRVRRSAPRAAARAPRRAARVEAERSGRPCRREVRRCRTAAEGGDGRLVADRRPSAVRAVCVQGVQQLTDRHRRRAVRAGARVRAAVDHHQVLLGGHDRVQQQLPVLAARVAIADPGLGGEHVVPVRARSARKDAVVDAEQAHHPVRHRPHRHAWCTWSACRSGSWPGSAGRGTRRRAAPQLGQAQHDVCAAALGAPRRVGRARRTRGRAASCRWRGRGQPLDAPLGPARPSPAPAVIGGRRRRTVRSGDTLGQPADQIDVGGVHVVQRQRGADEVVARPRPSPRRAAAGPARPPRCSARSRSMPVRRPVVRVQAPAHAGWPRPVRAAVPGPRR